MTAQVGDKLILKDEKFHTVLALDSPIEFSPKLFGMTPQVACTACWNGFWCDFKISKNAFVVENLYVNSKDDYYPEINGVSPTLEPYDDSKMLKYMGHHFYKGINYSVPYTGRLLAVGGYIMKYMVYMGPQRLRAFNEVSEWFFENGKVVDCKDLSSVIQSFREELEEKAGEERANPFLRIETKEYLSLSDYQKEWWINYL